MFNIFNIIIWKFYPSQNVEPDYDDLVINVSKAQLLLEKVKLRLKRNSLTEKSGKEADDFFLDEAMNFSSFDNIRTMCHEINPALLIFGSKKLQAYAVFTIKGSIYGGNIKNEKDEIIANWAEIPTENMKVHFLFSLLTLLIYD